MRHRRRRLQRQRRKFEECKKTHPSMYRWVQDGLRSPDPKIPGEPRRYSRPWSWIG